MCEHRVSIRLGPRSVGGAWARVSPEIIDCESLAVYHLFRQTGQTWSAPQTRTTEHTPALRFVDSRFLRKRSRGCVYTET